jgi:hypothetical protein
MEKNPGRLHRRAQPENQPSAFSYQRSAKTKVSLTVAATARPLFGGKKIEVNSPLLTAES